MHVVVAGSSGFLGSHLVSELRSRGHRVTRLVRRATGVPDESVWDPYAGEIDGDLIASADVVINLAGSPTAGNPHSKSWAEQLRTSRVTTTRLLAETIAQSGAQTGDQTGDQTGARLPAFLAGNGISFYGDHGAEELTERSDSRGEALLTSVTRDWEAAAQPAVDAGSRVCILRTAPVLDRASAPLQPLLPLFKLGLGTRLGNGRQHFPVISLRDWVGAVAFLAEHPEASGPFNLCCPETPTNAEFTDALAGAVSRRAFLAVPSPLLRRAAGAMAPEVLGSVNARPAALTDAGYTFHDPDVRAVLSAALG
ncbi:TIGR01777 family oxidoreductase [Nocardioides pacificus]